MAKAKKPLGSPMKSKSKMKSSKAKKKGGVLELRQQLEKIRARLHRMSQDNVTTATKKLEKLQSQFSKLGKKKASAKQKSAVVSKKYKSKPNPVGKKQMDQANKAFDTAAKLEENLQKEIKQAKESLQGFRDDLAYCQAEAKALGKLGKKAPAKEKNAGKSTGKANKTVAKKSVAAQAKKSKKASPKVEAAAMQQSELTKSESEFNLNH